MRATRSIVALAIILARPGPATGAERVAVALAPISAQALHGCKAAELEKALRGGLDRAQRFRLLPEIEEAPTRIEILECSRLEQRRQTLTSKGGPVKGPVGSAVGIGAESEVGVQTESVRSVILRARLAAGPRFVDVASRPKDGTLREATKTLRDAIDKALAERGQWLLSSRP